MSKKINIVIALLILTLSLSGCIDEREGLVAKVDEEGITEDQLNSEYELWECQNIKKFGEDVMTQKEEDGRTFAEKLKDDTLENIIMHKLIEKEAEKIDISVSDEEVEEEIQEYIEAEGEEEFEETLKMNCYTIETFKDGLSKQILEEKYKKEFMKNTEISDKDVNSFFDENKEDLEIIRASHILVKTEEEAKNILEKINSGEEFEDLAREFSVDKASGSVGGDLGYFTRGTIIPDFEDVAFNLEENEVSKIVKTEIGFHIIKLIDKKDKFEELRDDIIIILKEEKYKEEKANLKDKAKIKIY